MTGDGATKRKRVKLQEGDLFEFVIPDGRLGYGIIVKRGARKNGGNPYVAVFNSAHRTRPDLSDVTSDEVALAGWTMDALIYHGQWNVIARDLAIPIVPFPNFQVEMGDSFYVTDVEGQLIDEASPQERQLLDFRTSRAPIAFQRAFEALHGFGEWRDSYDELSPGYALARATRPIQAS